MINSIFCSLSQERYVCLALWITALVITIVLTVVVSYGMTYPVFFLAFVTPCHSKQVPEPAPVSI